MNVAFSFGWESQKLGILLQNVAAWGTEVVKLAGWSRGRPQNHHGLLVRWFFARKENKTKTAGC